jgi:hypothetical protein
MIEWVCEYIFRGWKVSFSSPEIEKLFYNTPKKICISAHSAPFLDGIILHIALNRLNIYNHIFYIRGLFGMGPQWCKEITKKRVYKK